MDRTKYPRTMNFPHSRSNSSDDVWWKDYSLFEGKEVVVTEKLDGENTTIYPDGGVHARSIDTSHHASRSWLKQFAAMKSVDIPEHLRICGENVFAFHSILYTELPTYFFVFGIYDSDNFCLSWDETEEWCNLLGLVTTPCIYRGKWDEDLICNRLWTGQGHFPTYEATTESHFKFPDTFRPCEAEGYVVRLAEGFPYEDFSTSCAKYVRENHVRTAGNWLTRPVFPNKTIDSSF